MAALITPTKGEALLIWRRRREMNQVEAAEHFGLSPDAYRDLEADARTEPSVIKPMLSGLKLHEVCVLMRRRKSLTQRELAEQVGCTRAWVVAMETGTAPVDRLREFWRIAQWRYS